MSYPGFGKESSPIRRPDALPSLGPPPSLQPLPGPPPPMLNPAPTPCVSPPKSITSQIPTLTIWDLENIVEARDISMTQAVGLIRDWLSRQGLKYEKLFLCGCISHEGLQGRMEEVERIDRVICSPILYKDGGEEADITIVMEIVKFVLQHPICAVILISSDNDFSSLCGAIKKRDVQLYFLVTKKDRIFHPLTQHGKVLDWGDLSLHADMMVEGNDVEAEEKAMSRSNYVMFWDLTTCQISSSYKGLPDLIYEIIKRVKKDFRECFFPWDEVEDEDEDEVFQEEEKQKKVKGLTCFKTRGGVITHSRDWFEIANTICVKWSKKKTSTTRAIFDGIISAVMENNGARIVVFTGAAILPGHATMLPRLLSTLAVRNRKVMVVRPSGCEEFQALRVVDVLVKDLDGYL